MLDYFKNIDFHICEECGKEFIVTDKLIEICPICELPVDIYCYLKFPETSKEKQEDYIQRWYGKE